MTEKQKPQYRWETYERGLGYYYTLFAPDGREVVCMSPSDAPEDISPTRDLKPIVEELNRLHAND